MEPLGQRRPALAFQSFQNFLAVFDAWCIKAVFEFAEDAYAHTKGHFFREIQAEKHYITQCGKKVSEKAVLTHMNSSTRIHIHRFLWREFGHCGLLLNDLNNALQYQV